MFATTVPSARMAFATGRTKDVKFRRQQLENLLTMLNENLQEFIEAMSLDQSKHPLELRLFEPIACENEIRNALAKLDEWTKPQTPSKGIANLFDTVQIINEPYGVVLIIGSWNYPLVLLLKPLVGAIAAGNCVVLKPSELTPTFAKLFSEVFRKYMDQQCYQVVVCDEIGSKALLKQRFDYIFFTGSSHVGRMIREAANVYLTPVTLELGGKNPVYLDDTVNINIAAKRIMWSKVSNCGQICAAADYLLCTKEVEVNFIRAARRAILEFFGDDPQATPDYSRIINEKHFTRIMNLMTGVVAMGGRYDSNEQYIEPTILTDIRPNDAIMLEEVFGPVLPIINVNSADEAIRFINQREKPLGVYVFSSSTDVINKFTKETSSGAICVNDLVIQFNADNVPFGGVGNSGMGGYGGKFTFDTFTHQKTFIHRGMNCYLEALFSLRYPPYTTADTNRFINLMKKKDYTLLWSVLTVLKFTGFALIVFVMYNYFNDYYL